MTLPEDAASTYFDLALDRLRKLKETQLSVIQEASSLCADRIATGGLVFLFGSGHSRFMCDEMAPRQGCYVGFVPLAHVALSTYTDVIGPNGLRPALYLEKFEGYAEQILQGFHFGAQDAFIIISTSGIRPVVVEMALKVRERGMPVIAVLSREHCESAKPAHSSGKKLIDVADIVIDNLCPIGDCVLELEGLTWKTGPLSTLTGAMIMNMLRCETARLLLQKGHKPVILPSHQFVEMENADEQLERYYEAYRKSLRHLYE